VLCNFGPLALDALPIYIATSIDEENRDVLDPVLDMLNYIANKSGFWPSAKVTRAWDILCVANGPRYQAEMRKSDALDLIALWPFKVVGQGRTKMPESPGQEPPKSPRTAPLSSDAGSGSPNASFFRRPRAPERKRAGAGSWSWWRCRWPWRPRWWWRFRFGLRGLSGLGC
jgi:hypothetical protein